MKTEVTRPVAERLYAQGWRVESTILDGQRIVKDFDGVYATVVPTPDRYVWSVWSWTNGTHLAGGTSFDAFDAALAALIWIEEEHNHD